MKTRSASVAIFTPAEKKAPPKKKQYSPTKPKLAKRAGTKLTKPSSNKGVEPWFYAYSKGDEEYNAYMTKEWGFEKRGDKVLFENICLGAVQGGLSWGVVFKKRQAFRRVFHRFDVDKVAKMTDKDLDRILEEHRVLKEQGENARNIIVCNRKKLSAFIHNAKLILQLRADWKKGNSKKKPRHGVFDELLWSFVNDKPILNISWKSNDLKDCPTQTQEGKDMEKKLKELGFKYVGSVTCYAIMQSIGMVLDHPFGSKWWKEAKERLEKREGGYQER